MCDTACIYLLVIKQGATWLRVHTVWRELWWGTRTRVRCRRWHHHQFLFHLHIFLQYHWLWDRDYRLFSYLSIFSDKPFVFLCLCSVTRVKLYWHLSVGLLLFTLAQQAVWHQVNLLNYRRVELSFDLHPSAIAVCTNAQTKLTGGRGGTFTESKQLHKTGQVRVLTVLLVGHLKGQVLLS